MTQSTRSTHPLVIVLGLSGIFFAIFLMVSGFLFLKKSSSIHRGSGSSSFFAEDAVGVIEISGVIMDSKKTLARLEKFEEDDQIKAVVLRMNSPGGAVAPSQEIYQAVKSYSKPVVVSIASVAASGAYYIASGAKKIFANPGSMTGSIGVIMEFASLEKLYDWAKINRYSIKSGKFKDSGADYRSMTPEEKALFQTMVDDILSQFKQAVSSGRKLSMAQVSAIADGRVFSGAQAKNIHLVDELGTLKDAVLDAAKMAKIKGKPTVIYSEKPKKNIFDLLMDDNSTGEDNSRSLLHQISSVLSWVNPSPGLRFHPGVYWLWSGGQQFHVAE